MAEIPAIHPYPGPEVTMTMKIALDDVKMVVKDDDHADASFLEQGEFADRLKAYRRGDFHFVGVRAEVELRIPHGNDYIIHKMVSPGLWGVESDSDESYLKEVFEEERRTLFDMIRELTKIELPPEEPPSSDDMTTVQVCHANCDTFHRISEKELLRISALPLSERKSAFMGAAVDTSVSSSEEVDAVLVMDGSNDEESWKEYLEEDG